jgi:hypothetical protein
MTTKLNNRTLIASKKISLDPLVAMRNAQREASKDSKLFRDILVVAKIINRNGKLTKHYRYIGKEQIFCRG